ncbi:MAG: hypothetical protein ACI4QS_07810 [Comamonas sp.]
MFFSGLFGGEPRYIRRTRVYLQEARMAMLEHSIAAEHYKASAEMYAERARRLEEELAMWQAQKNPAQVLEDSREGNNFRESARKDGPQSLMGPAKPAVGMVRAA